MLRLIEGVINNYLTTNRFNNITKSWRIAK